MYAVFWVIDQALSIYWFLVIAAAIFSWLYAFNIVNSGNQVVNMIGKFLYDITEPALRPIRRIVPMIGSVDISPIVLLLGIGFLRVFLRTSVAPIFI